MPIIIYNDARIDTKGHDESKIIKESVYKEIYISSKMATF
jgi:hypothetical protein